ncbi:MAG: LysM domain-containing protein [Gammaproteobacteria bacterium]
MTRKIPVFLGIVLFALCAFADEIALVPDHPQNYTVQKGDTLWDIAGRFLRYPWQWPDIWEVNPHIDNPHLIYPGDVLGLTYRDGRPILGLAARGREVKLSPKIREYARGDAIPTIPLDIVQPFLTRPLVVGEGSLERAPYVVGSQEQHIAYGAGNRVYVRGLADESATKFSIYRPGPAYQDPDTGEILGYQAEHLGEARVERFGDPATFRITRSLKEIRKGDRLLPEEDLEFADFVPHAPSNTVDGRIIGVVSGVRYISQYDVVVLNRGDADGMEPGHVLALYRRGEVVEDVTGSDKADQEQRDARLRAARENPSAVGRMLQTVINDVQTADRALRDVVGTPVEGSSSVRVELPAERAGEAMVFRTFDRVSFALVMRLQQSVFLNDGVRNP